MTEPAAASVAAVVANYNRADLLDQCLESLTAALAAANATGEIVLVDDGSADDTARAVADRFPAVDFVRIEENCGFPCAATRGIERTTAEWFVLLNNDATMEPDAIVRMLEVADDPTVGAVGAQMRFTHRPGYVNSAGIGVDVLGIAFDRDLGEPVGDGDEAPREVFGVSGGASMFRRAMFDAIGGFDERYHVYLEDVDVAWRARMAGWRALYVPRAVVYHHHSATTGHGSPYKYFHVGRNRVRLLARNADGTLLRRYGAQMVLYDVAYVVYVAVRERTLAPARGRLAGLREWRPYRRLGAATRRPVALEPRQGVRAALRRREAWAAKGAGT